LVQKNYLKGSLLETGTTKFRRAERVRARVDTRSDEEKYQGLPKEWDWRNVNGISFDTPVKAQGGCGSCYAMAAASSLEARFRIASNNSLQIDLSPQNILDCSVYNQGCAGGYPFLVMKHVREFGAVEQACSSYTGDTGKCNAERFLTKPPKQSFPRLKKEDESADAVCNRRYYVSDYNYVGGYYGACNEVEMMKEIYKNGPIIVAFEAPGSLFYYSGGIFHGPPPDWREDNHVAGLNVWEQTNHAVVGVGWGEKDGKKFWIMKNTWGAKWGEGGYFRILRGVDECGIESMSVAGQVILPEEVPSSFFQAGELCEDEKSSQLKITKTTTTTTITTIHLPTGEAVPSGEVSGEASHDVEIVDRLT